MEKRQNDYLEKYSRGQLLLSLSSTLDKITETHNNNNNNYCKIENVIKLLEQTVPIHLHEKIREIFMRIREMTIVMNNDNNNKFSKEKLYVAITIAEVMKNLWSRHMLHYVENLILKKACEEKYFDKDQWHCIKVIDKINNNNNNNNDDDDWIIHDKNNVIIHLIWYTFNMKQHFDQVKSHRYWIVQSYRRLQKFLPKKLTFKIIKRHDLSKYAFSQAIGYTLRWVWGVKNHPIWIKARSLHLLNEPHHPQMWREDVLPGTKMERINTWMAENYSYYSPPLPPHHNYYSSDMPPEFLLESLIDMVAVEWERKKGANLSLSNRELVFFDGNHLNRYNCKQREEVFKIINHISEDE